MMKPLVLPSYDKYRFKKLYTRIHMANTIQRAIKYEYFTTEKNWYMKSDAQNFWEGM